jgi:arsenate reductase
MTAGRKTEGLNEETTMSVTIYHNPRCSKSRQTLALLQEKGVEPEIIEYLSSPPDAATLGEILGKLGMEPRELMRRKEAPYKDLNLADEGKSQDALIQAMVDNPILIERPIVLSDGKAALGRPPEQVLDIL